MQSIRIFVASIVLVSIFTAGSALAQTGDQAGPPLKLLAGLPPPRDAKAHEGRSGIHARIAHKNHKTATKRLAARPKLAGKRHRKLAAAQADPPPAQATPIAPPVNAWSAADAAARVDAAGAAPKTAPADKAPQPNAVSVGGQTVQVESSNQINELDLAADNDNSATAGAAPSESTDAAAPVQAVLAAPVNQDASQNTDTVGRASWIAQVLAAFGGAVAAGAVAWFLIGSGPVRIYG